MGAVACFAAVDVGAESGRVMKGVWDGSVMRLEERHRFTNGGVSIDGTLRWDIVKIWAEVLRGMSALRDVPKGELISIGVDTWAIDYVLLSRTNEIVVQPYHYRDRRTRGLVNATFERIPRQELYAANGLQFMELNTIYQLLAAQRDHPELLQVATTLLMIPDFLHWCLSGERAAEFTNATTTGFLNPRGGTWAFDLLKRLDLPDHFMPRLVMPGTILGPLRDEVAQDSGLGKVSVVAPATHDTASAVAAVPTESTGMPGWAYISSGTWSLVGIEASAPILTERACQMNVTNEGGVDGTWRVLKNVMGLWLLQRCRVAFAARSGSYSELVALAETAQPGIAFIDPDDHSFVNPPDMPRAIQEYCRASGQPVPESIGAIVRCVLESLALKYRVVLHSLEELTGTPCRVLHIVGGGSRNDLLNELAASACNCEVIAGPVEATALGNVLIQARARGEIASLAEMRAIVRASSELRHFLPRASDWWAAAAARFQRLVS